MLYHTSYVKVLELTLNTAVRVMTGGSVVYKELCRCVRFRRWVSSSHLWAQAIWEDYSHLKWGVLHMWRWHEESVDGEPVRVTLICTGWVRAILAGMGAWLSCIVVWGDRCWFTDSLNTGTLSYWLGWRAVCSLTKMSWLPTLAFISLCGCLSLDCLTLNMQETAVSQSVVNCWNIDTQLYPTRL